MKKKNRKKVVLSESNVVKCAVPVASIREMLDEIESNTRSAQPTPTLSDLIKSIFLKAKKKQNSNEKS